MADIRELRARFTAQAQGMKATFDELAKGADNLSEKSQEASRKMSQSFRDAGDRMKRTGKRMTLGITAPLVGMGGVATKVGIDFEDSMAKVRATSGATESDIEKLTEKARKMGATTKFSASESADAFYYMALAGWDTSQMLGGIEGVMNLAAASGEDLAIVSDIVTDSLTAFKMEAEDSGRMADVLAKASSRANTDVSGMGLAFQYVAPIAGALGYNIEDTATALGVLANNGIKGEKGGTALRTMLSKMDAAAEELGFSLTDSNGEMRTMDAVMGDLRTAFAGMTADQQAQTAASIFGQEAMAGVLAIVNTSEDEYNKLSDAIYDSEGAAKTMAETMEDTLGGTLRRIKSGLQELALQFFDVLKPGLEVVATAIENLVNWFGSLSEKTRKWLVVLGLMAASIGPLLVVLGTMVASMGGLIQAGGTFLAVFGAGKGATGILSKFGSKLVWFLGPAGLVVGIIAALFAGGKDLYGNWDTLQQKLSPFVEKLKLFGANLDKIGGYFLEIIKGGDSLNSWLEKMPASIQGPVKRAGDILASIRDKAIDAFEGIKRFAVPIIEDVVSFALNIFGKIKDFWVSDGAQILQAVQNAFNGIMAVIKFVMPVVLGIIKSVWGNIKGVINGALNVIMGAIKVFSGLFTGDFKKMWEGIKQMFKGAIEFVWNYIQLLFIGRILKGAKAFATTFKSGLQTMWQGIVALFKGSITTAWNLVKTGWTTIWNVTKSLFTNIWNFLKNTWQTIRNVFSSAINFLKKAIDVGWNAISGTTLRVFRGIWDFLKNTWNTIKNFMSNSVSTILTKVRNTWNSLWGSTKDIFRKIYNGIKDRFTDIVNAAKNLPKRIGDGIGNMASKVTSGVTKVINKLASILGKGVNGVIGGINWVLGKIGVDTKIPKWDVPQWGTGSSGSKNYGPRATGVQNYAYGTKGNGHKGGMALVGDGKGSNAGQELIQTPDGRTMLSPGTDTLVNLPKGTRVWSATDTRKLLSQIPGYAWGTETLKKTGSAIKTGAKKTGSAIKKGAEVTWDATKTAGGAVKDLAFDVWDYVSDPKKLLEKTLAGLGVKKPSMDGLLGNIAGGGFSMIKDKAVGYLKEKLKPFKDGGGGSYMGTGNVPGNVKSWISAAIARTGVPSSWLGALTTIAMKESGGRTGPSTINKWDSNWTRGTPSMGLMQTIRPTFDAYKEAGWNDIMNPIHNAAAAINYIKARYGNVNNVPGIRALREGRAYVGYADGGIVDTAQLAWIAEGGWAESIISHDPAKRNSQRAIWEQTGKELGFSSSDGAIKQLLEEIRDGVIAGHNLEVLMNDRVVGKILEPHITEFQNRKENTQKKFRKG